MDLANMTIVEGGTGVVLIDCLLTAEPGAAALALYRAHLGARPVKALIHTPSHVDHYDGARGVLSPDDVDEGRADVFAPDGFIEAIGGENVLAGAAMTRRAQFQFGPLRAPGPRGQVDAGLKYVDDMGRAEAVLARAREGFGQDEYRWIVQVLYHVIFADPGNEAARTLCADAFEQLGDQTEHATWRNACLCAAQELRHGVVKLPPHPILSLDLLEAVATETLFDFIAGRLDAGQAAGLRRRLPGARCFR